MRVCTYKSTLIYMERKMIQPSQGQGQQHVLTPGRDSLLQQHPVLVPVTLLSISVALCIASFFASALFPVLALQGIPGGSMCLLFAFVSGIAGILTSIIGLIERIDRARLHPGMLPQPKEGR